MLGLQFYHDTAVECVDILSAVPNLTSKVILFQALDSVAREIIAALDEKQVFQVYKSAEQGSSMIDNRITVNDSLEKCDIVIARSSNATELSSFLMGCLDLSDTLVIAPVTGHYFRNRALFNISIPKSGTHLLYKLVEAFGYGAAVVHNNAPLPGNWYCVEYSNSHTVARDFFLDSVRRDSFGLRDHPFSRTPTLFIYRNPIDILLSEANYYHKEGATIFSSYLRGRHFDDRVTALLDDAGLLGSLRDRIINFAPWLDFENVIPISFEELIGADGGGSDAIREKLIWSLQLKLHISGEPHRLADKIFDKDSPTFNEGQIGAAKERLPVQAYEILSAGSDDFMRLFGYMPMESKRDFFRKRANDRERWAQTSTFSRRIDEFRKRPLVHGEHLFPDTPYNVEWDFLSHNIVRFDSKYYAIHQAAGPTDLLALRASGDLKNIMCSSDLLELKLRIVKDMMEK